MNIKHSLFGYPITCIVCYHSLENLDWYDSYFEVELGIVKKFKKSAQFETMFWPQIFSFSCHECIGCVVFGVFRRLSVGVVSCVR